MGVPPIDVDTTSYESAADLFYDANNATVDLLGSMISGVDGGGGMAGFDSSGQEWAAQYDQAAAQAVEAGGQLGDALGHIGDLLRQSGSNHADADSSSTIGPGLVYPGGGGNGSRAWSISMSPPPSANGSSGNEPHGWFLVEHALSWVWPNGHQDQLRSVGSAWTTAGDAIVADSYPLSSAISELQAQNSPEIASAVQTCQDLQTAMSDLGGGYQQLGQACSDYAGHLDEAHKDVTDELKSLIEWTVGIEAAGFIGSFFTFGGAEAAAQAAEAGRIAATAARIGSILSKLAELVRIVVSAIGRVLSKIIEVLAKFKDFVAKGIAKAFEKVAGVLAKNAAKKLGKLFAGRTPSATELKEYAESQGWKPTQTPTGPLKYVDENGIPRITIKEGSARTAGSETPHVELKDPTGQRIDPDGNPVTRKSPGNHTPITLD